MDSDRTIICVTQRAMGDDHTAHCCVCLRVIFFRPHSAHIRRKICERCGYLEMEKNGQIVPEITDESRRELKGMGIDVDEAMRYLLKSRGRRGA